MIETGSAPGLVGRARFVKEIAAALVDAGGFGVMLVGEAGVGKTATARAVVRQLTWTAPVLKVTGGSSLRNIPFGALAPYLHSLSVADAESPVAILRAVMAHLAAGRTGRSQQLPLLVVDDAHELDDSSSALLAQLISARRAKVLVMIRNPATAPAEFRALSADRLLARFTLRPLDREAVSELCAQVLGGPVLTGTAHALALATGGNPMFLRTLLEQGVTEGYLDQRNGLWRLTNDQPMMHLRLADLICSQLRLRNAEELEALDIIALAEPVALAAVEQCVSPEALTQLTEDHLIVVGTGPDRPVSLTHPLYGEVLRGQVPAARSMELRRRVLAVMDPGASSLEGFLRCVSWGLDCGVPPDDAELLKAAVVANGLRDYEFALRAARAVSAPGLRDRALTEIARVQCGRGNLDYAQELVDEVLRRSPDAAITKDAIQLSFEVRLRSGASYADLRDIADRWGSLITAMELRDQPGATADDVVRSRLGCRILECRVLILEGRFGGVEDELRAILASPEGTPEIRVGAMALLAELLGSVGRSDEGSTYTAQALEIIDAEGAPLLGCREFAAARHVIVLTNSGRGAEAKAALHAYCRTHPRSIGYFAGWGDFVDGVIALREARNREARDRFLLALEALRESNATQVMTLLMGLAAYASALAGDTARAQGLVEEFERTPERGSRTMRLGGRIFVTATAALLGDAPAARADLMAIAATAEKDQLKDLAATALGISFLLGEAGAIGPLIRVLQGFEGPAAVDLRDFAVAAGARNVEAMVAAATVAGQHGNASFEFAALSYALQFMRGQGSTRQARAVQRRLVNLTEQREGPVPPPLAAASPGAATPRLTPTERKIVELVRNGATNREIADAKNVSVRTVEGHLYRIFAKLGVSRREDLRDT